MRVLGLFFLALISFTICDDDFPLEKDIIVLTDLTFEKAVEKYEYLLVLFYAPWCGHCKRFHPEFEKAATVLRKENLYLAKVDITTEPKLAMKYEIQSLPTVKLFYKGQIIEYTGGRKDSEIINWMRKKTGPPAKDLKTVEDVEKFKKENDIVLVYFGSKKDELEEFTRVARKNDNFPFAVVESEDVIKKYTNPGTVVLFRNFDGRNQELKEVKEKKIDEFIYKCTSPKIITKFDERVAQTIFGHAIPTIFLFASEKSDKWEEYQKLMRDVSNKINGEPIVVITDIKEGITAKFAEYIGVKVSELPTVRIIHIKNELKRYKMEEEINEENILKFVEDWKKNKLKPILKTQEEPKENNGDVFVIVGKTFEKEVINNDKDVMLLFYAPWDSHCKALQPKYEEVAKKLKSKNPKLVLAKMDANENEVESVNISGFPTVKFYPGNKKDKAPIDYKGDKSVEDMIKFIKTNAATPIVDEEETKKETKDKTDEL